MSKQKDGVKGEKLAHLSNGILRSCPFFATLRRVAHLNLHHAPPTTLLYTYFSNNRARRVATARQHRVTSAMITSVLRSATLTINGYAGVQPDNIDTRSLRSSGAMTLLHGGIDPDRIRILGRWRSCWKYCRHGKWIGLLEMDWPIMRDVAPQLISLSQDRSIT